MSDQVVWVGAGRIIDGDPVEEQGISRAKARMITKENGIIGVAGDAAFMVWKNNLPSHLTTLIFFDRRKKGIEVAWMKR